jgi:phage terminase large subunit
MIAIVETVDAPVFRGGAQRLWESKTHEAIISGPYETGKTFAALYKLHALLCLFPNSRALMVRKTYKSVVGSAVVTYEKKVLPISPDDPKSPISKYGGEKPDFYQYPNGSRLYIGGMDNASKFLSAEYDFIYVNQAEELRLDDWEKLVGRATGRAGNAPYTQVFGDCNPDAPTHWIKQRATLQIVESRHEDNPRLYRDGAWTEDGKRTIAILDGLTGLRYKRGRLGLWVAAEGQVYEYDPALHLISRFDIPPAWRRIRAIDFGYTNPFVCQWWAFDGDGRMYMYREMYMSKRTVKVHSAQINTLSLGEHNEATVADHDAEDRATLRENGISTIAADKRISIGIERVEERLKIAGDGKPRLFVLEDSLVERDAELEAAFKPINIEQEFPVYTYPLAASGKPVKEVPIDLDNHSMDAMRYAVMYDWRQGQRRQPGTLRG